VEGAGEAVDAFRPSCTVGGSGGEEVVLEHCRLTVR
jgi:hypothetical protein